MINTYECGINIRVKRSKKRISVQGRLLIALMKKLYVQLMTPLSHRNILRKLRKEANTFYVKVFPIFRSDGALNVQLITFKDGVSRLESVSKISVTTYQNFLDALESILYNLNPCDNYIITSMTGDFQGNILGKIKFGTAWWLNNHHDRMGTQIKTFVGYFIKM